MYVVEIVIVVVVGGWLIAMAGLCLTYIDQLPTLVAGLYYKARQAVFPLDESHVVAHYVGDETIQLATTRGELVEAYLAVGYWDKIRASVAGPDRTLQLKVGGLSSLMLDNNQIWRVHYTLQEGTTVVKGWKSLLDFK